MKLVFSLFLMLVFVNADEMQRLDLIVKDIEQLRINYELSQKNLKRCEEKTLSLDDKNKINEKYKEEINNLENQIYFLNKIIKNKEIEIEKLKVSKNKNQIICKNNLKKQINEFPELKMRNSKKVDTVKDTTPTTYRVSQDSIIYSAIDGKEIDKWEKLTSFTSKLKINGWIKISGYFVNKKWRKADKEMWIEA
ncbi:MAG: hypothetical protein P8Y22_06295, partial [Sulfurimonas sp.]